MLGPDRFHFLGRSGDLADHGWDDPTMELLWRYNIHYFADLTAGGAASRADWHRDLLTRWVNENPPAQGTGWEPFPTSLRIVNWIKWVFAGNELSSDCVHSLAVQTRWLARRLERHLLGNHLFANAKALVFAGSFFEGPEASAWISIGAAILKKEIPEQILPDGGHFERSTMYHALALEDVLDLCNLASVVKSSPDSEVARIADACRSRVAEMRRWLSVMSHPDGEISFFNDAAFGVAPSPAALESYAVRLGFPSAIPAPVGVTSLPYSGYARLASTSSVAIIDVARVAPDYLPSHAHADTLSFELSLFGHRVIVNSGTSLYGVSEERVRQRGTAAHNTVVLDGVDSSEVWSGFRVGHRAVPFGVRFGSSSGAEIEASHDGYRRLPGAPVHRRQWTRDGDALTIADEIIGRFRRAESRLHLHPAVSIAAVSDSGAAERIVLRLLDGQSVTICITGGALHVESSTWHPRFGESVATSCVVARFAGPALRTVLAWGAAP